MLGEIIQAPIGINVAVASTLMFVLIPLSSILSQPITPRTYVTERTDVAPRIDGIFDESCWDLVEWTGNFTQYQPEDGTEPTQETQFKVLYDEKHLYLALRCFDTNPDEIVSRMSRRDGFQGDWVEVNLDSYNDKRTAFSFTSSVSGVKGDEFVTDDGNNWDPSWNPIWHLKTNIDSLGWTAEVAIPFSQIRYAERDVQEWGMQVTRRDFRNESRSSWQYIPSNAGYWVSGFGVLNGITGIEKQNQLEIQPYVLSQADFYEEQDGNPFADGSDLSLSAGLDGKFGVTSDLTLDFTINPDFGQVESDPSAITLDGFEIFFEEKRPFFIENRNLFQTPVSSSIAGGDFNQDLIFYSRRIGAPPHKVLFNDPANGQYVDQPDFTSILGAAKFSGKTQSGLSVGILESVTSREKAEIRLENEDGVISSYPAVEPLTNFFVSRIQQDIDNGNTVIGGIISHVHRDLGTSFDNLLHRNAYSGSFDILHRWKDKAWNFNASFTLSHVLGTEAAILRTQTALEHNFQRPDADHLEIDNGATSLTGTGGNIAIGNFQNKFRFQAGLTYRSPQLELNDIGFLRTTDQIIHYYWMGFRENNPFWIFRTFNANYNHWSRWDFGGTNIYRALNVNSNMTFKNFWTFSLSTNYENKDISNTWLRGGPSFRRSPAMFNHMGILTDKRKAFQFELSGGFGNSFDSPIKARSLGFGVAVHPSDALNFSIGPSWSSFYREDQYVSQSDYGDVKRYILSQLNQITIDLVVRMNLNITPELTVQYYAQPYVSRGRYSDFKRVTDPLGEKYTDRMTSFSTEQETVDASTGLHTIDEDLDGTSDYSFVDPDFNFMQFRSNLVARWEYTPGSEIFVVWNQSTTRGGDPGHQVFNSITKKLFDGRLDNVFLVKLTYRFVK